MKMKSQKINMLIILISQKKKSQLLDIRIIQSSESLETGMKENGIKPTRQQSQYIFNIRIIFIQKEFVLNMKEL